MSDESRDTRTEPAQEGFEVWPENWPAWQLFLSVCTQWRIAPSGAFIGLDYGSVEWVLNCEGVGLRRQRELRQDLRFIEHGAVTALAQRESGG